MARSRTPPFGSFEVTSRHPHGRGAQDAAELARALLSFNEPTPVAYRQGKQRRSSYFNIRRDIRQAFTASSP